MHLLLRVERNLYRRPPHETPLVLLPFAIFNKLTEISACSHDAQWVSYRAYLTRRQRSSGCRCGFAATCRPRHQNVVRSVGARTIWADDNGRGEIHPDKDPILKRGESSVRIATELLASLGSPAPCRHAPNKLPFWGLALLSLCSLAALLSSQRR